MYALALREAEADGIEIEDVNRDGLVEALDETQELLERFADGKADPSVYGYYERPIAEDVHEAIDGDAVAYLETTARMIERVRNGEYVEQDDLTDTYDMLQRVEREVRPARTRRGCF